MSHRAILIRVPKTTHHSSKTFAQTPDPTFLRPQLLCHKLRSQPEDFRRQGLDSLSGGESMEADAPTSRLPGQSAAPLSEGAKRGSGIGALMSSGENSKMCPQCLQDAMKMGGPLAIKPSALLVFHWSPRQRGHASPPGNLDFSQCVICWCSASTRGMVSTPSQRDPEQNKNRRGRTP
jgi:hypothetical protein